MHHVATLLASLLSLSASLPAVGAARISIAVDTVEASSGHGTTPPPPGEGSGGFEINDFKYCYDALHQNGLSFMSAAENLKGFMEGKVADQSVFAKDIDKLRVSHIESRLICSHIAPGAFKLDGFFSGLEYTAKDLKTYSEAVAPAKCKMSSTARKALLFEVNTMIYEWTQWYRLVKQRAPRKHEFNEEYRETRDGWEALAESLSDTSDCRKSLSAWDDDL